MNPELPEALRVALRVIEALEALGVPYHVGGSYASSIHGIPRQTQDIDMVVDFPPGAVSRIAAMIGGEFYIDEESVRRAVRDKSSFNVIHLDSGIKVDVFVRGDAPFDLVEFARHESQIVGIEPERRIYVKTAEDILLRKLLWFQMGGEISDRQWTDVLGIARTSGDILDRQYLERWARELGVEELFNRLLTET